jgi:hypothetical protein
VPIEIDTVAKLESHSLFEKKRLLILVATSERK